MPFKSKAQRGWLWANRPAIARKWTSKYGSKIRGGAGKKSGGHIRRKK